MKILGIETSCDETAASVSEFKNNKITILSNIVSSQIEIHKKYGGVVPEVAAREHVLNILPVIDSSLHEAKINKENISNELDGIAITKGPGLITSLITGIETAKTLSYVWQIPLLSINHVEGHIYANFINKNSDSINFPAIILTVSGGHTILALIKNHGEIEMLGETRDDAAGEAFDKAAKLMNIGYPGGPIISKYASEFNKDETIYEISLPRPMINSNDFDFSFSGLKTAIRYAIDNDPDYKSKIPEYCHEFQQAIVDVLISKTIKAAKKYNAKTVLLAGGVSANSALRTQLQKTVETKLPNTSFSMPELKYTTDNAAMIATAGCFKFLRKDFTNWQDLKVDCNLVL